MKRVRYAVAASLDGYIAGPKGEFDWIVQDPEVDFAAMMKQFDTILVGRKTFMTMVAAGRTTMPGMKTVVVSTTLKAEEHPGVTIIGDDIADRVGRLRQQSGKDIWLFGGGELFRSLLQAGLVDTVEVSIEPVLLGSGVPLLPLTIDRKHLKLATHRVYRSGVVHLEYDVQRDRTAPSPASEPASPN